MIIRSMAAICAATLLAACGRVDYGLEKKPHAIIKDVVICRGDKYPTGFNPQHVDRTTLEALKTKCDAQYGKGHFPIEVVVGLDPNIQPFDYRDSYNDETGNPEHRIYGVFCPSKWDYKVMANGYTLGGNSSQVGECQEQFLGKREVKSHHH